MFYSYYCSVPKSGVGASWNDHRPAALTSLVMESFERAALPHLLLSALILTSLPTGNTEDAVLMVLHLARWLFVDSSALDTAVPARLIDKLLKMGYEVPMCNWLSDFLTNRPQLV